MADHGEFEWQGEREETIKVQQEIRNALLQIQEEENWTEGRLAHNVALFVNLIDSLIEEHISSRDIALIDKVADNNIDENTVLDGSFVSNDVCDTCKEDYVWNPENNDYVEELASTRQIHISRTQPTVEKPAIESSNTCANEDDKKPCVKNRLPNFISRNIELAGRTGLQPITKEEEGKLKILLEDLGSDDVCITSKNGTQEKQKSHKEVSQRYDGFKMDAESIQSLKDIDSRLQIYSATQSTESWNNAEFQEIHGIDSNKCTRQQLKKLLQDIDNNLKKINPNPQDIHPVNDEELKQLLSDFRCSSCGSLTPWGSSVNSSNTGLLTSCTNLETPALSKDVLSNLLKQAKSDMPSFKFNYSV